MSSTDVVEEKSIASENEDEYPSLSGTFCSNAVYDPIDNKTDHSGQQLNQQENLRLIS